MKNSMLAELSTDELNQVHQATGSILNHLNPFFSEYPCFDPVRFPATALTTAVENPHLPLEILCEIAKVPVWIFTIDAVIDEKLLPDAELRARLKDYEEIVTGKRNSCERQDEYGTILLYLAGRIREKPLYANLRQLWEEAYINMIEGMLFETNAKAGQASLDQYLEHGLYSIGVPMYVVSTWILQSKESSLDDLDELAELMRLSGICIRLANDLRTYEKEKLESNLNAIFIKEFEFMEQGLDRETARRRSFEYVASLLHSYFADFLSKAEGESVLKKALRRLTHFSVSFYSSNDFHTVSQSQLLSL